MTQTITTRSSELWNRIILIYVISFFCYWHLRSGNSAQSGNRFWTTDSRDATTDSAQWVELNIEASDDPNLIACLFCPAVRWKTLYSNIFTIKSPLITLQPHRGAFCLSSLYLVIKGSLGPLKQLIKWLTAYVLGHGAEMQQKEERGSDFCLFFSIPAHRHPPPAWHGG